MDYDALTKFMPVLGSPLWQRLEDEILLPRLDEFRNQLEIADDPVTRGQIKFIRYLLNLKRNAREM